VLVNRENFSVRSEKYHGGVGLKRCNRSRGFSANFTRLKKEQENYIFLQGLDCKTLSSSMAVVRELAAGQNCSDLDHGRAREERE
jgi:hypothetical protein